MHKLFLLRDKDSGGAGASPGQAAGDGGQATTGVEPQVNQPQQPPEAAPAGGQGGQQTNQPQTQTQPQTPAPYAVFPTSDALKERMDRVRQQEREQFLQDLGVEDPEALRALVKAAQEREDAEKTELEKLQAKLDKALADGQGVQSQADQLAAQLKQEREDRLVERLAVQLAFADPTDATSLVDRSKFSYSEDGKLDEVSVKTALEALLEAKPHLRGSSRPAPAIDAQAGTGKGPATPQNAKDYSAHLPARLRQRAQAAGVAQQ